MGEFRMPALGAGMDEGKLLEWYVEPGQQIRRGDIVALVDTDKAAIEVEIFESGTVEELLVDVGTKVPVGTPLARIRPAAADGESVGGAEPDGSVEEPTEQPAARVAASPAPPEEPTAAPEPIIARRDGEARVVSPIVRRLAREHDLDLDTVAGTGPEGTVTRADVERAIAADARALEPGRVPGAPPRPRASPYARRMAREHGLALEQTAGSGPGGAVVARDLETGTGRAAPAAETPGPAPVAEPSAAATRGTEKQMAMRGAIARAMSRSNREIPHYHLGQHVDMETALVWIAEHNRSLPPAERVLPAALVLEAVAAACRDHPVLNGYWIDGAFQPADGVHLGVAIALRGGGLVAPAIHDADTLSVDELMAALRDLVGRARAGRLRGSELTDATITVTNLGEQGVETVHGVIYPPQVALVGTGRITERPWAAEGMIGVRRSLHVTLAADHRVSDGHVGGLFLAEIARNLERPESP